MEGRECPGLDCGECPGECRLSENLLFIVERIRESIVKCPPTRPRGSWPDPLLSTMDCALQKKDKKKDESSD